MKRQKALLLSLFFFGSLSFLASFNQISAAGDLPGDSPDLTFGPIFKSTDSGATWRAIDNGLLSQGINTLAAAPGSPGTVYAGTEKGVFKTIDGGSRWVQSKGVISLFIIVTLAVDPVTPSIVYAGGVANSGGGAFKSEDAGLNWKPINSGLSNVLINRLAIDPNNHTTLYAQDDFNLFKSTNGGNNWVSVLAYPPKGGNVFEAQFELDPFNSSTLYVTGNGRAFKTTDAGGSWTDLTDRVVQASVAKSVIGLAVDPITPSTVYINGSPTGELIKTTDGGNTWEVARDESSRLRSRVVIATAAPSVLYARTSRPLLKSTDQGMSWVETGLPPPGAVVFALDPSSTSTIYAAGQSFNPPSDAPLIRGFSLDGKKLFVIGQGFDAGAVILLNGQEQHTRNSETSPDSILIGKKAGKKIKKNPLLKIQVKNSDGKVSQEVTIWPPID